MFFDKIKKCDNRHRQLTSLVKAKSRTDLSQHEKVGESGDAEAESGDEDDETDKVVAARRVLVLEGHDGGDQTTKQNNTAAYWYWLSITLYPIL